MFLIISGPVIDFHMHHVIHNGILAKTIPCVKQKTDDKSNYLKFKISNEKVSDKYHTNAAISNADQYLSGFSASGSALCHTADTHILKLSHSLSIGLRAPPAIII